jgi:hypothetical protein
MKLRCLVVAACTTLLAAPSALAAGGAAGQTYGGSGGVQNEVSQGAAGVASGSSLPFTGLDLALLIVGGIALLVIGAGLRRAARRSA